MNKKVLIRLIVLLAVCLSKSGAAGQEASKFFQPGKLIETGVYYYPEAWSQSEWDRDLKNMSDMGFEFIHVAEFAWAFMEPQEGKYDFAWLDKVVDLAARHQLKVIMCTPSACPPAWLTTTYPEVLVVNENGIRAAHGTRVHGSWSSAKFLSYVEKIDAELAKHYGKDKRIWGWQIDNEPSHYGTVDYNPQARTRFIEWLKKKSATLDALNKAWGTEFWSGVYTDFEQIDLPNYKKFISGPASPHSFMDFKRFCADECAAYVSLQNSTLRKYISPDQFVTSNFMHNHRDVDPWRNKDLDFISYTMYPVAGYSEGIGSQGFRIGDSWLISYACDFYRPLKGNSGVMELQPGQVNWGRYNPLPYPGVIHAWLWNAYAGGLSFICSYRYREPLAGSEQYHYGMVGTDGVTPLSGGKEYSRFMKELKELRTKYNKDSKMPESYAERKTAVLFNIDNVWNTELEKQTYQWDFEKHLTGIYSNLKSLSIPVDFIGENKDLSAYRVVIAPAYQLIDAAVVEKWKKYVENGGNLVLTCRTGEKDRDGHFFETKWAEPISSLIGGRVNMYDVLPGNIFASVKMGSDEYKWNIWGDILETDAGTETWASYSDQFYSGKAAVTFRKTGKGSVTYIGVETTDGKLEKEILKKVYSAAGIGVKELPEGVILNWRDGFWIAMNYSSVPVTLDVPEKAKILLGSKILKPCEVIVWTE